MFHVLAVRPIALTISLTLFSFATTAQVSRQPLSVPDRYVAASGAIDDVAIQYGSACGNGGGVQAVLKNTSTDKRVIATVVTSASDTGFSYLHADRSPSIYTYPQSQIQLLNPGDFRVLGCSTWNVRSKLISQFFAVSGAYYPSGDVTFPPPSENPLDFVQIYVIPWPACNEQGQLGTIEFIGSSHPSKNIVVDYVSIGRRGTDGSGLTLTPQGRASTIGCSGIEGQTFGYTVTNAHFAP